MPRQSSAGSLTILRCLEPAKQATKTWTLPAGAQLPVKVDFNAGSRFRAERRHFTSVIELSSLLTSLERDPLAFVIRGEPLPDVDLNRPVRRKKKPDRAGRSWFRDVPEGLHWVLLDFDKFSTPAGIDVVADPEDAILYLVSLLPACFQSVSFHWQLSSSAGIGRDARLSAHLWFWFNRAVTDTELSVWAERDNVPIDAALFRTVQPHYTAAPVFIGMIDPLPRRSGLWKGSDDIVSFPIIEVRTPRESSLSHTGFSTRPGFEAKLELLGDRPLNPHGRGFHKPLLSATASYAATHDQSVDRPALKAQLRDAIIAAPKSPQRPRADIERYLSDEYLDEIIDSAVENYAAPIRAVPPHFTSASLPLNEAIPRLENLIAIWCREALASNRAGVPQQLGIRATAGLGKSQKLLEKLVESFDESRTVDIYVPHHRLADEFASALYRIIDNISPDSGPQIRVQIIRGREHVGDSGTAMCVKADIAAEVARAGHEVWGHLCEGYGKDGNLEHCEHYHSCSYVAQFQDSSAAVRILTHEYLFIARSARLPKADAIIIDESFHAKSITEASLGVDRLTAPRPWRRVGGHIQSADLDELESIAGLVRKALEAGAHPRDSGITIEHCRFAARVESDSFEGLGISPGTPYAEQKRRLSRANYSEVWKLWRFWTALESEVQRDGPLRQIRLVCDYSDERSREPHDRLFIYWCRELRVPDVPVLLLDADLDPIIGRRFFKKLEIVDIPVERRAEVIQVLDTVCSRQRLLAWAGAPEAELKRAANRLSDVQSLFNVEAAKGGRVLLVTYKPVAERIKAPAGCAVEWFGNIRGLDSYKDFDTIIIAGREQPRIHSVEDMARALFADSPLPNLPGTLSDSIRGYRIRNGSQRGSKAAVHPDSRVQALLEQIRERESVQAIDRLRLVHRSRPACVIILSNLVLDITVDRLVTWSEIIPSRIEQAFALRGAILLSPAELSRCFPDLWRSEGATRSEIRRLLAERGVKSLIDILIGKWPPLTLAAYRKPGQRGSATRAIIRADAGDLQKTLEAVVGEIGAPTVLESPTTQKQEQPEVDAPSPSDAGGIPPFMEDRESPPGLIFYSVVRGETDDGAGTATG
jgi:hypothetical protein